MVRISESRRLTAGQRNREALAANPDTAEEEAERLLARAYQSDSADRADD